MFLYLKFRFYSFVFSNLSLYFQKTSLFFLDVCHDHTLFIVKKKLKFSTVHILVLLRGQLNFLNRS